MGEVSLRKTRDLLESELQAIVRDAFATGYLQGYGRRGYRSENCELYCQQIQEVVTSYFDREKSDAGAQDESSETRVLGDSVQSEAGLSHFGAFKPTGFDEITSEFAKQLSFRFPNHGLVKPVGHCKLEKMPDGSVHAVIKYH